MKILLLALLAILAIPTFAQNLTKTMLRLPDTGQAANFTSTAGEDSDYSINPPFFIKNGDGTVTDTVTGLIWQQADGGEMTYDNAVLYCFNLVLGGSSDWRMPTAQEAYSILNHNKPNPALDVTVFSNTGADYWWTGEPQVNSSTKVWATNAGGGIGNHAKSETISAGGTRKFHVRAVRDAQAPPTIAAQFTENGDGSVTDHLTNLVWQKVPLADTLTWEQALNYAENLTLAGQDDWRLPNIKELQSLNDESLSNPSVDVNFFPGIGVKRYWSSTSLPNQPTRAWYWQTQFGITTYDQKTRRLSLICVRGPLRLTTSTADAEANTGNGVFFKAFPNPFANHIALWPATGSERCELSNAFGQVIFSGENVEQQDFSGLPKGLYFLKIGGRAKETFRLIKS